MSYFVKYARFRAEKEEQDILYRVYVSDAIKAIYNRLGGEISTRYYDMIQKPKIIEETRTPEEIVDSIRAKIEG